MAGHELRVVKTEKKPLIENTNIIQADPTVARAERNSLHAHIENRAVSS